MSGVLKVVNESAYKPTAVHKVVELKVRAMLDAVPGAWHEPRDVMEWIAQHSYVQDVELVPNTRQHDGTAATTAAPDCAGRNGAHTPGPWAVGESYYSDCCRYEFLPINAGEEEIATVFVGDAHGDNGAPISANARLIAAAPDLLAACEAMVAVAEKQGSRWREKLPDSSSPLGLALAAIAKAEGR